MIIHKKTKQEKVFLVGTCIMGLIMSMVCGIINGWIDERWFWCFILTLMTLIGMDIVYRMNLNKVGVISGSIVIGILLIMMLTKKVYWTDEYDLYTKIGLFGLPYVLLAYNVVKGIQGVRRVKALPNLPLYETILLLYEVFALTFVITNYGKYTMILLLIPLVYVAYRLQEKQQATAAILCMISGILIWVVSWYIHEFDEENILLFLGVLIMAMGSLIALILQSMTISEIKEGIQEELGRGKMMTQKTMNKESLKDMLIHATTTKEEDGATLRKLLFGLECMILMFWMIRIILARTSIFGKMSDCIWIVLYGMYIFRVGKGKIQKFYQSNKTYLVNIVICLFFVSVGRMPIAYLMYSNIIVKIVIISYFLINLGKVIQHIFKSVFIENSRGSVLCIICGVIAVLSNFLPWYVVGNGFNISIFDVLKALSDYDAGIVFVIPIAFMISLVMSIVIAMIKSKGTRIVIGAINFLGAVVIVFGVKGTVVKYASRPGGIVGEITGSVAKYAMDNYTSIGTGGYMLIIATLAYLGFAIMQKSDMSTSIWSTVKQVQLATAQTASIQAQPTQVIKVRCIKCGALLDETAKFCMQCGHAIYEDSAQN